MVGLHHVLRNRIGCENGIYLLYADVPNVR